MGFVNGRIFEAVLRLIVSAGRTRCLLIAGMDLSMVAVVVPPARRSSDNRGVEDSRLEKSLVRGGVPAFTRTCLDAPRS